MGRILYLDCSFGISGDMTVGALLDLGADREVLEKALKSIPVQGFETKITRVVKSGLDVCDFDVVLEQENFDHDMDYLYGHEHHDHEHHHHDHDHEHHHDHDYDHEHHHHDHDHDHEHHHDHDHDHEHHHHDHDHDHEHHHHHHDHDHDHEHHHDHDHDHDHHHHDHDHDHHHHHDHSHPHVHRGMPEITEIIEHTDITRRAKDIALNIFNVLAKAESKAHGKPMNEVHFHEVGAIDSIADIIAAAVCLDNLDIRECVVPVLCEGSGTVRCQHGILPVPVPAVVNIVQDNKLKMRITDRKGEFVTPTGAAIVAAMKTMNELPEAFTIERVGMGNGKRKYDGPGFLRAMIIEA